MKKNRFNVAERTSERFSATFSTVTTSFGHTGKNRETCLHLISHRLTFMSPFLIFHFGIEGLNSSFFAVVKTSNKFVCSNFLKVYQWAFWNAILNILMLTFDIIWLLILYGRVPNICISFCCCSISCLNISMGARFSNPFLCTVLLLIIKQFVNERRS